MDYRIIDLQVHGDKRGKLVSLEGKIVLFCAYEYRTNIYTA